MIIAKYLKSHKTIVALGIFVASIPLIGVPSWARDMLTYLSGLAIAFGTYTLNKKTKDISTIKESLIENVKIGIGNDAEDNISAILSKE